jgi:hypothetical protein
MWLTKYIYCLLHRHADINMTINDIEIRYCLHCGHIKKDDSKASYPPIAKPA